MANSKTIFLSLLYVVIALILLGLIDIGLYYFFRYVIADMLNWFNRLSFFWKLFILLIGGGYLLTSFLGITNAIISTAGGLIFNYLPYNLFTSISTLILAVANSIFCIILLWKIPTHYNFWVAWELVIVSFFILMLNTIVVPLKIRNPN